MSGTDTDSTVLYPAPEPVLIGRRRDGPSERRPKIQTLVMTRTAMTRRAFIARSAMRMGFEMVVSLVDPVLEALSARRELPAAAFPSLDAAPKKGELMEPLELPCERDEGQTLDPEVSAPS